MKAFMSSNDDVLQCVKNTWL